MCTKFFLYTMDLILQYTACRQTAVSTHISTEDRHRSLLTSYTWKDQNLFIISNINECSAGSVHLAPLIRHHKKVWGKTALESISIAWKDKFKLNSSVYTYNKTYGVAER